MMLQKENSDINHSCVSHEQTLLFGTNIIRQHMNYQMSILKKSLIKSDGLHCRWSDLIVDSTVVIGGGIEP